MADPIDEFLSAYEPEVARIARRLRKLLKTLSPDVGEELKLGWKTVSYGNSKKFCAISPHAKWVNLQFFDGANLPDPKNLLEGTGKSMRHVKLRTVDEVEPKSLADLIRKAAAGAQ